jgi:hypothetical protein
VETVYSGPACLRQILVCPDCAPDLRDVSHCSARPLEHMSLHQPPNASGLAGISRSLPSWTFGNRRIRRGIDTSFVLSEVGVVKVSNRVFRACENLMLRWIYWRTRPRRRLSRVSSIGSRVLGEPGAQSQMEQTRASRGSRSCMGLMGGAEGALWIQPFESFEY